MEQFYIGQKFTGTYPPAAAIWCNQNDAHIERVPQVHDGNSEREYIIVANPKPTDEELQADVRAARNALLDATDKYVSVPDYPIDESTRNQYIAYRTYLRDYTLGENWWLSEPLAFDAWVKSGSENVQVAPESGSENVQSTDAE